MNIDPTAADYWKRCRTELGQQTHDSERVAIWCYDHPPRKPLPKGANVRERHVYISGRTLNVLAAVAGYSGTDALAESILLLWIKENVPDIWEMFDRHVQELQARIKELRQNEPELQPQEEV